MSSVSRGESGTLEQTASHSEDIDFADDDNTPSLSEGGSFGTSSTESIDGLPRTPSPLEAVLPVQDTNEKVPVGSETQTPLTAEL